ncbi:ABC transporter permease [Haliangium sp.]|uniref:ABC transporter permease n=1 Tax=Haliangium sp. TaxID=2663208 RepID=UPI003D10DF4A
MILWNALVQTLRQIRRNPMRSSLTTLGVLIGVAAVIAMVALGSGAAARVEADLSGLGQNLLFVMPGTPGQGSPGARSSARPFTDQDVRAVRREIAGVEAVAPTASRTAVAVYGNANWRTMITGSDNDLFTVQTWRFALGRRFNEAELRAGAAVCVLGETVRHELFGTQNPVDARVRVGDFTCTVIGVLAPKGQSTFGQDQDDFAVVPLLTFQRRVAGNRDISFMFLAARHGADTGQVKRDVEALMSQRRHIREGEVPDFFVRDMKELAETVGGVTSVLTSLLAAIAAVSLLVGGIGIMNIMLVAVSERTREIGLRLAIGARGRDVLAQFLVESIALSSIGGVAGILLGLGGSYLATAKLGLPLVLSGGLIGLPFLFAVAVGVIFGFVPARKAARMNPIDALRHE